MLYLIFHLQMLLYCLFIIFNIDFQKLIYLPEATNYVHNFEYSKRNNIFNNLWLKVFMNYSQFSLSQSCYV